MDRHYQTLRSEFVKMMKRADHRLSRREAFNDFVDMAFFALAKTAAPSAEAAQEMEDGYMAVVARYEKHNMLETIREVYPKALAHVSLALGHGIHGDFLGEAAGELEALNSHIGQFFTPFSVSYMMAQIIHGPAIREAIQAKRYATLHEPACGSGGMVLAFAKAVRAAGYDPAKVMYFDATDLSSLAYRMCYVQTTLTGLSGTVRHGNTLSLDTYAEHVTPVRAMQLRAGHADGPDEQQVRKRRRSK